MHFVGVEVQYKCIKESLHGGWAGYLVSGFLQALFVQHYLGGPQYSVFILTAVFWGVVPLILAYWHTWEVASVQRCQYKSINTLVLAPLSTTKACLESRKP